MLTRLKDIIIGILAVREIEPLDMSVANQLYRVVEEVESMQRSGLHRA
jgi:Mg-chelatase subunit ChlI